MYCRNVKYPLFHICLDHFKQYFGLITNNTCIGEIKSVRVGSVTTRSTVNKSTYNNPQLIFEQVIRHLVYRQLMGLTTNKSTFNCIWSDVICKDTSHISFRKTKGDHQYNIRHQSVIPTATIRYFEKIFGQSIDLDAYIKLFVDNYTLKRLKADFTALFRYITGYYSSEMQFLLNDVLDRIECQYYDACQRLDEYYSLRQYYYQIISSRDINYQPTLDDLIIK